MGGAAGKPLPLYRAAGERILPLGALALPGKNRAASVKAQRRGAHMVQIAEPETMPATIEATLNYLLDTGEMPVTFVAAPGSSDVRSSSTPDPRRVTVHNGRPRAERFALDRDGFRFV